MAAQRKTIFITGAGSGIGRATAQLFAERGWFIGLFDVSARGLEETAAMLPESRHLSMTFDVRDRAGWARAIDVHATGGRLDVLFNNAGIARGGWYEDVAPEDADLVIDINVKGVMNGVYAALPLLRATAGARIINVASVAGIVGLARGAAYTTSKFAVRGLTEALDVEFSRYGVRVVCLMPWFIETPLIDRAPADSNTPMIASLKQDGVPVYPVRMAAERAWDAAHGSDIYYMVGKAAERAWLGARFFPNALRARFKRMLKKD